MKQYLDADDLFLITKQGFDFFHEQFGVRYPLPKYDQLWVPDFNAGAMENFGCVIHAESHYIFRSQVTDFEYEQRANTILHEMAHMWFGDLVTMRWWDDLWLNESFAEWASHWCNTRRPGSPTRGPRSCPSARTGATGRTSSPRPTRSTARCPTSRRSRSTSTASRTPRAPRVIKQLVAYVGHRGVPRRAAGLLRRARLGQRHLRRPALRAGGGVRPRAARVRRPVAGDGAGQHAAPGRSRSAPTARTPAVAVLQEAPADYPTLRTHRHRGRPVRPRRRPAGPARPARARRLRRAHRRSRP